MWKREWISLVDYPNGRATKRVRSYDVAFSRPSEQYANPDWTRGVLMSKDVNNLYTVEDMVSIRDRVMEVENLIFHTALRDGRDTVITLPKDPNAAAGAYAKDLQRRLGEMGFTVKLMSPVKSKITRFAPFASVTQAGFVNVVKADWNKDFFEELENFNGDGKNKDDQVDVCSDAFWNLNQGLNLPTFSLPDFSSTNSNSMQGLSSAIPSSGLTLPSSGLSIPSY